MRVLAVEDDEGIAHGLKLALSQEGWAVGPQGTNNGASRQTLGHAVVQRVAAVHGGRFERVDGAGTAPARYRIILGGP